MGREGTTISDTMSTNTTIFTPPATIVDEKHSTSTPSATNSTVEQATSQPMSSIPKGGKTYLLREVNTGKLLTLVHGNVCLKPAGTKGASIHWYCCDHKGWFGFKNVAAGRYLGHDEASTIRTVPQLRGWECFQVRHMSDGGYVLLLQHWDKFWPVKNKKDHDGVMKLGKADAPVEHGLRWHFIEV